MCIMEQDELKLRAEVTRNRIERFRQALIATRDDPMESMFINSLVSFIETLEEELEEIEGKIE